MKKDTINKQNILSLLLLVAMIILIVIMLIDLFPLLKQVILDRNNESKIVTYIDKHGAKGIPLILGMAILQVPIPFIPTSVIQLLSGLCYGIIYGTIIFLIGNLFGNIIVFTAIKQFGKMQNALERQKRNKKHSIFENIEHMKNPFRAALILFLVPGVPTILLTFFFTKSSITFTQYLAATIIAGIPSSLLCTWLGERISKGDWQMSIIIVALVVILFGVLLIFRKKLFNYIGLPQEKKGESDKNVH